VVKHVIGIVLDDRLLVGLERLGVDRGDLALARRDPLGRDQRFSQQPLEVQAAVCEDLADHVIDATAEVGAHRLELFEQAPEQLPFNRVRRAEVEHDASVLLADAVDAAHPLLEPNRVPRQVVVHHQVAELEVDALAGCFGGDADLALLMEQLLDALALDWRQAAVDGAR
jgi:hypothetical protein